jgi:hypothetical protein
MPYLISLFLSTDKIAANAPRQYLADIKDSYLLSRVEMNSASPPERELKTPISSSLLIAAA